MEFVFLEMGTASGKFTNQINVRCRKPSSGTLHPVALLCSNLRLQVTANVVLTSSILVTLMMEAIHSSETSILQKSRGVTSQKTTFSIVTAVKASNLT
jgi:hypothetical protein